MIKYATPNLKIEQSCTHTPSIFLRENTGKGKKQMAREVKVERDRNPTKLRDVLEKLKIRERERKRAGAIISLLSDDNCKLTMMMMMMYILLHSILVLPYICTRLCKLFFSLFFF